MPGIKVPKEALKGSKSIVPGIYDVRLDTFEPTKSKKGSTNLCPQLIIVNNPDLHGRKAALEWLNINMVRTLLDFCHCFGVENLEGSKEEPEFPGPWDNLENPDPTTWKYRGPMLGRVGKIELAENTNSNDGNTYVNIKRYFCSFPNCKVKHSENLFR